MELGAADELPLGCAEIDEDEVAGGKPVAMPLAGVDAPHPEPHEPTGVLTQRFPFRRASADEVEEVVRDRPSVHLTQRNLA